ncbi:MAG: MoaD/ThiS family protein [Caulobacteraceae bacterium]
MIRVSIPSQLQGYCGGASRLEAKGATVDEVLRDLDARFIGLRFRMVDEQDRIRRHVRLFVGSEEVRDVALPLEPGAELMIFGALSGG